VKIEDVPKILESLNPVIESITDPNIKAVISTLITIINVQQKVIEELVPFQFNSDVLLNFFSLSLALSLRERGFQSVRIKLKRY